MFKNDSQSVQQLLVAEKRAEEIINQARKRKNQRLKQAKEDAHAEITLFKSEKDKEFKDCESKFLGSKESAAQKVERDTEKSLHEMEKSANFEPSACIKILTYLCYSLTTDVI